MRQMEAAWYDGEKINKSRTRVDRLGYFDEVTVETPPVAGTTDQVDVNVNVKERPTGNIMIGAGFSSSEKFVLSGSVQQQNLFGSGKHVGIGINTSKVNKLYSLSYTDPYYTVDGISSGFDIYHRNTDTTSLAVAYYGTKSTGGGVRFGLPIADEDYVNFGLAIDATRLTVTTASPQRYQDYVRDHGDSATTLSATAGWAKETIDSRIYPTKGAQQRLALEVALPGGNQKFYRATYQHQRYFPVTRQYTLMVNGEVGWANGYGGKMLPFYKNFYIGGVGSVRGYEGSSLGPVDPLTSDRLGGTRRLVGNVEFLVPMPGMGLDKSVRLSAFLDAGQVWGTGEKMSLGDLRYSTGIAAIWSSPMGPLKFSFAKPINSKEGDKLQRLQFQMGAMF
jgi:outer membrane protein insertion porin family